MSDQQPPSTPDLGTALVTGGSRGIGAAVARRLGADGYAVAVGYAGSRDRAEQVVADIVAAGGRAAAFQADVADPAAVSRLVGSAVTELGRLSVLVNNAGISGTPQPHLDQTDDELRLLVETNILSVLVTSREAVRLMSRQRGGAGGVIVNVASLAAHTGGLPGLAAYAATKAAVVAFSRGLSTEVAGQGIRVVSVSPGTIETHMVTPEIAEAGRRAPVGRLGQPGDVAGAVAYLVSPDAAFVTGVDLAVAGGR